MTGRAQHRPAAGRAVAPVTRTVLLVSSVVLWSCLCAPAQEALVTHKVMNRRPPSISPAPRSPTAGSAATRAVAVVDRFGVTQVVLRDRLAVHHRVGNGKGLDSGKLSHQHRRSRDLDPARNAAGGGSRHSGVVVLGGGMVVQAGGSLVGAIGVSGAPGGDADEACARRASRQSKTGSISERQRTGVVGLRTSRW